ncbi:hypothetical protein BBJ28_00020926 [Nothophytophthora sp. Chile5]|nr:hypothetical protein BBJ28_00020926 [Nothophytophthora sp. Chile5]
MSALAIAGEQAQESTMAADLSTAVQRVKTILDRVYSPCAPGSGANWKPHAFDQSSANRRYLWSDAFGVCNCLSLYYATSANQEPQKQTYLAQADALIADVHDQLGRFRFRFGDHARLSWMFALNRMNVARQDPRYNRWAVQLAETAHGRFVVRDERDGRAVQLVWKMAVDLQHAEVDSEGNLDPMEALVIYRLLQRHSEGQEKPLQTEIAELERLMQRKLATLVTNDELDAGEALWLAQWAAELFDEAPWTLRLHHVALASLDAIFQRCRVRGPPNQRLLFREMGAVLGLQVGVLLHPQGGGIGGTEQERWRQRVAVLLRYWEELLYARDADISPLMYAAALLPGVWSPWQQPHT